MRSRSAARKLSWSTIGRPVDVSYPTNRAILILSLFGLVAGVVASLIGRISIGSSLIVGLQWAGAMLLGWALGRETDPDRNLSAFVAAGGALIIAITLGPPSFLFLLWFILAMRYINRSTGVPPGILDFAALYGIKIWLGFTAHWTIPLLTFPTMLFADLERFPRWLRIVLPLLMPAAAVVMGFSKGWRFEIPQWGWLEIVGLVLIALSMLPVISSYRTVRSVGDRTGSPLKPHRVQWSLVWIVVAALILTLTGTASVAELGPIWAAMAGTSIGWAIQRIRGAARP